jgi:hypothetical protein
MDARVRRRLDVALLALLLLGAACAHLLWGHTRTRPRIHVSATSAWHLEGAPRVPSDLPLSSEGDR